jgi:hypothetical protein
MRQMGALALAQYMAGDWASALAQYEELAREHAVGAIEPAVIFAINHCRIELAEQSELASIVLLPATAEESPELNHLWHSFCRRIIELCRLHEFQRATALLRCAARQFEAIRSIYDSNIDPARGSAQTPWTEPTAFLTHGGFGRIDPERSKARFIGKRVLLIAARMFMNNAARSHEPIDNLLISALRFGLDFREINTLAFSSLGALSDEIERTIEAWRPDLIIVENLSVLSLGLHRDEAAQQRKMDIFRQARRRHGSRVVTMYPDAWLIPPDQFFAGVGDSVDIVHHMHPTILSHGTVAERSSVFCYPFPFEVAPPRVPADSIPRYGFIGSIASYQPARLVWWAELGRIGAPVDFFVAQHEALDRKSVV